MPTEIPFPTMTVGQQLRGELPTPGGRPNVRPGEVNPATAVALVNRPTATPDTSVCPSIVEDVELESLPATRVAAIDAIQRFLNSGGSPEALRDGMISQWQSFGETGYLRDEVDLTGEGTPEIVAGYVAPGDVGTLLILGCQGGRYVQLFETIADGIEPPLLLWLGEMNNNPNPEVVFARRQCNEAEFCEFQTGIITWEPSVARFVNLLTSSLLTLEPPSVRDVDGDEVSELVVELTSNGTAATGPLRTGFNIYDWNGELYLLSRIDLDPPRYHIQVVHNGDIAFSNLRMEDAIAAYERAISDDDLRYWFNDGPLTVISYAQYRRILAYAYLGNGGAALAALNELNADFAPEEGEGIDDLVVYVELANRFIDTLSITSDLHESCLQVLAIIEDRSEAVELLNRYGSRSPTYDALQLCPY